MKPIVLASTSPQRREILAKSGLAFISVASDYEEDMSVALKPSALAKFLSKGKAESVAGQYRNHIVIGADTFIALGDSVLGKPHTATQAKKTLRNISGKELSVITGFTVIDAGDSKTISKAIQTKVYIKPLTEKEICSYVETKEPLDKAGAFAIQGRGAMIVKEIKGDYFNVMGLPLYELLQTLKEFGIGN